MPPDFYGPIIDPDVRPPARTGHPHRDRAKIKAGRKAARRNRT